MTFQSDIQEILDTAPDHRTRSRNLHLLAYRLRDADDMEGFDAVITEIAKHPHPRKPDDTMDRFRPSRTFQFMYDGKPKVLVAHEKHDTMYFDITRPDDLANATLFLVRERLKYGMYWAPELHPAGANASKMVETYIASLLTAPVKLDADTANKNFLGDIEGTDLYKFSVGEDATMNRIAQMVIDLRDDPSTNDGTLATLVWALHGRGRGACDQSIRELIEERSARARPMGPALARVLDMLEISDGDRARTILKRAYDGDKRAAGRLAWELLQERSQGEYEKVDWWPMDVPAVTIEPADFDAST